MEKKKLYKLHVNLLTRVVNKVQKLYNLYGLFKNERRMHFRMNNEPNVFERKRCGKVVSIL